MKVEVYGGYHSPWVQAVLLALHDADVEHRVGQVPPFEAVKQWGVLMPAVSIDDGPGDRILANPWQARMGFNIG